MQNAFLRALQDGYCSIYDRAAELGEATVLLVPCAECLESSNFSQIFVECHVLHASRVPGFFMNLCGQGLEVKDSTVYTHMGFNEKRACEVLQTESMYEKGNNFRVLVMDRPLFGKFRQVQSSVDRGAKSAAGAIVDAVTISGGGMSLPSIADDQDLPAEWLSKASAIDTAHFDEVDRFRKTFVQVPGCEASTAERVREIVGDTCKKVIAYHNLTQASQKRQLKQHVSRATYAALHSWLFPHLTRILAESEDRLEKGIESYSTAAELVDAIPGAQGRGLGLVDLGRCSRELEEVDHKISPHEKIACINEAYSFLQRCVAEGAKADRQPGAAAIEITGDDVISLFILAMHQSCLRQRLAHVAHVEMYLQGAAGRSGSSAAIEEAGYAVSALQAALQFFLEDRRHAAAGRGAQRSTNVFSSYLQGHAETGVAGHEVDGDLDRAGMHLQGLVRQARAQGLQRR